MTTNASGRHLRGARQRRRFPRYRPSEGALPLYPIIAAVAVTMVVLMIGSHNPIRAQAQYIGSGGRFASVQKLAVSRHGDRVAIGIVGGARTGQIVLAINSRVVARVSLLEGERWFTSKRIYGDSQLTITAIGQAERPAMVVVASPLSEPTDEAPTLNVHRTELSRVTSASTTPEPVGNPIVTPGPNPSGAPMPGPVNGWHQVLASNFAGRSLGRCWGAYAGVPPSSPTALWSPRHVVVRDGMAQLLTYRDKRYGGRLVTAGMSSAPCVRQTYGLYKVRFRMDRADGVKYTILLWPERGRWPCAGEVDFGEDGGGQRTATTLTTAYCDDGHLQRLPQVIDPGDFSQWHTLTLEWLPQRLQWSIDGRMLGYINSPTVPSGPMALDIQAETNTHCASPWYTCIDASTPPLVSLDVDWVAIYAPGSRSARR